MKILIASITDSGILRVRSELIKQLLDMGHQVVIVTPKETDYQKLIDLGCFFLEMQIQRQGMNPLSDISAYCQYNRLLAKTNPDIVLLFTTKPNIYCGIACRRQKIPVVMNITGMGSALGKKGFLQKMLIRMYRVACNGKNIKRIFFQNNDSMMFFKNHRIGRDNVYKRIPGSGVNLDVFTVQPFPHSDTVHFLFIARVMKEKGIEEYIDAAKRIRENHKNTVFHVLGSCDEEYKDRLKDETEKGTIVYHGRVSNIPEFERISQCTIQPSYYPEGMSNVILEAAASGRPVITTDHPGCREGVDDGITGFIVPIKDSEALTRAVEKFLNLSINEREKMGLCGRKKMEREFDRRIVTNAYLEVLFPITKGCER